MIKTIARVQSDKKMTGKQEKKEQIVENQK